MKRIYYLLFLLFMSPLCLSAQNNVVITGKVTDSSAGHSVMGATVYLMKNGARLSGGTFTDSAGNYSIKVDSGATDIVVSYIGLKTVTEKINGRTQIDFLLGSEEAASLGDVVVVGYGTQRKSELTGATSSLSAAEIAKRPVTRVEQALQGTSPGVVVASNSGQPGAALSVRIRGANSITGSNEPLYVIDGFIGGNIESIDPNDIQSVEILKDAVSTAIYGSRGSNGVVIITTKSGQSGKQRVDFGVWFNKNMIPKELNLMDAYDFARTVNTQYEQAGQSDAFTDAQLAAFKTNPGTDWQRALQQKPWVQNYDASVSGGSEKVKYRLSFNYLDQPGLIINQYYKRATLRSNTDIQLNKKLDVQFNLGVVVPQSRNNTFQGDITDPFAQAYQWDPTSPIRDSTGNFILRSVYGSNNINPVAQEANQEVDESSVDMTGTGILTYKITDWLTFTSQNFYEINWNEQQSLYGPETSEGIVGQDYAQANNAKLHNFQNSNFLTYKGNFGEHSLTATLVYEQTSSAGSNVNARSNNLSTYALGYYNLGLGATQTISSGYTNSSTQSFVGRINYSFKDKYFLTASVRDDGSSHLTNKYSTFPSVGVAWNITKEKFLENSKVLTNLKLRASWGIAGNQAVNAYATIPQIGVGGVENATGYYYDGTTPTRYTPLLTPVSQNLKWEDDKQTDVGIDADFFNSRITFTADGYYKHVTNLLYYLTAPQYLGGGTYAANIGSLQNKGIEFAIGGTPISTNKVKWTLNYNMSFNRNKLLNLGGLDNVIVNNIGSAQTGVAELKVGDPLGEFYGYKFLGTWKTDEASDAAKYGNVPGDSKYLDVNGDGLINDADRTQIGNGTPKYTFGFSSDLSYGNFTLSLMFYGTHGNDIYSGTLPYTMGGLGDARNATNEDILNMWTPENQTNIPTFSPTSQNLINSSRYVYDASFIKLKNISLTYNVPSDVLKRWKLNNLQVYVSGQNIFCITKYPGYDPEVSNETNAITEGLESGVIPNPKTYTIGVRFGF